MSEKRKSSSTKEDSNPKKKRKLTEVLNEAFDDGSDVSFDSSSLFDISFESLQPESTTESTSEQIRLQEELENLKTCVVCFELYDSG